MQAGSLSTIGQAPSTGDAIGIGSTFAGTVVEASLYEPVSAVVTADTALYTADNATWPTADGGILDGASDFVGAKVVPAHRYGVILKPPLVVGYGFGILPRLVGEAFGVVGAAGVGAITPPISGAGVGEVDDDDLEILLFMLAA